EQVEPIVVRSWRSRWSLLYVVWNVSLVTIELYSVGFVLSCSRLISVNLHWKLNVAVSSMRHMVFFAGTSVMY
ncbi:hypothetical protein Tco_1316501, partial [Tanacetum coccineum]